jgi:hypothetical protein
VVEAMVTSSFDVGACAYEVVVFLAGGRSGPFVDPPFGSILTRSQIGVF